MPFAIPPMAKNRIHLTLAQKNSFRRYSTSHPGLTDDQLCGWVRSELNKVIGRSTVNKIVRAPEASYTTAHAKHSRRPQYPVMEQELLAFVNAHEESCVLSDFVLWEKANALLSPRSVSFSWVQKFKRRNGVRLRQAHGEAGSVDTSKLLD